MELKPLVLSVDIFDIRVAAIVLNDELAICMRRLARHGRERVTQRVGTIESRHHDGEQRHDHH